MVDIKYNNTHAEIYEEFLEENIPRDLYKLYNSSRYESQRNPSAQHQELHMGGRRSIQYDYGKATYRVVSADEAIQIVKNDKNEVQNLRIIFNGDLVEYELRDNGSIYAIYRSPNEVVINDKVYKNVGYAPWQQVIRAAEKIYWTDEYSKKLSPEEIERRKEKAAERVIYKRISPTNVRYSQHEPYANLVGGGIIKTDAVPDTGKHVDDADTVRIKNAYTNYDLARKALRNLEAEKDTYEEEEYQELKTRLEEIKQETLYDYNNKIKEKRVADTKKVKEISLEAHKFNAKLAEYTKAIQAALKDSYELKRRVDNMLVTTANTSSDISNRVSRVRTLLRLLVNDLSADNDKLSDPEYKKGNEEELAKQLDELIEYKKNYVNSHLSLLIELEGKIKDLEELIKSYRPNVTAKKARADAADNKELSKEMLDIIEFTDFQSSN